MNAIKGGATSNTVCTVHVHMTHTLSLLFRSRHVTVLGQMNSLEHQAHFLDGRGIVQQHLLFAEPGSAHARGRPRLPLPTSPLPADDAGVVGWVNLHALWGVYHRVSASALARAITRGNGVAHHWRKNERHQRLDSIANWRQHQ